MPVSIKRIYESPVAQDGYRILIDRLWPRGIKKESAAIDLWLKEVAPSPELRTWFNHDPEKWTTFQKKYKLELKNNPAWRALRQLAGQHKALTLLFAAKDEKHNHAVLLARLLNK
ncbi:DUF488 domain-containing protein [Fulvivirgaceae bacterium PWU4]|uniref:DUF488 domain-containing protein n=1 Tax=Chryseosolibacter histidini TaxID=2782349 RepID=A0AAP2GI73_9BACT|nr:DUF488 domain-containing protein [Chryseosolibacter histidini]MBT1696819.1 DUF488 domain-containing protein [Chryseosolibacter histidini]